MHDDLKLPPPVVAAAHHPGESQVYLIMPAGWRLNETGLDELRRVLAGAVNPGDGQTTDWIACAGGGFCWAKRDDADLVRLALKDIAADFMERIPDAEGGAA